GAHMIISFLCYHEAISFFFQAEDGIRDRNVTGVQTCALPISNLSLPFELRSYGWQLQRGERRTAVDQRRAISHRNSVIQALADVAQDTDIPEVSVRLLGPVATMVSGMLPSGQRTLRDAGAPADIAAAWADGATNLASKIS